MSEHTIDLTLIHRKSKVLDLGCRNFQFANGMLDYVDEVYCVDADNDVKTDDKRINLLHAAVYHQNGVKYFVTHGNGTGNYVNEGEPMPADSISYPVQCMTIDKVCKHFDIWEWDIIKMDIEGAEYGVLSSLYRPIANQITFELHEHTGKKVGRKEVEKIFNHLSQWYDFVHTVYCERHGCGMNWWDVLIVKKHGI